MRFSKIAAAIALGISAVGLSACATTFPAQVSRFQAMPAPAGQSFYVVPIEARNIGGLEFSRYASMVSEAMRAQGYAEATSPERATMLVRVGYGVDHGREVIESDPFYGAGSYGGFGRYYDPFYASFYGRPFYPRFGYYGARSPFYYGWDDPFIGGGINSYTVYTSFLDLDIRRRVDGAGLFEGHAKARSQSDNLQMLVPNLVTAMFTGFPGRSGETVRISVPLPPRRY